MMGTNLPVRYTDPPMGSDDQISAHNCCILSNEKHGVDDIAYKYHKTWL